MIDHWHRDRGFDELGYHFVIGNGTNSGDGQIEVGPRWTKQKWAPRQRPGQPLQHQRHRHLPRRQFQQDATHCCPTRSLVRLIVYLMKTYHVPVGPRAGVTAKRR